MAYREFGYETAKSKLLDIASDLEYKYPKAAASRLEGLEETLTVHRLRCQGYCVRLCAARTQWNQPTQCAVALSEEYPTSGTAEWPCTIVINSTIDIISAEINSFKLRTQFYSYLAFLLHTNLHRQHLLENLHLHRYTVLYHRL